MKKGISLIVLVITIIVIIILAGAVILSLSANNPIAQSTTARNASNLAEVQSSVTLYLSRVMAEYKGAVNTTSGALNGSNITADGVQLYRNTTVPTAPTYGAFTSLALAEAALGATDTATVTIVTPADLGFTTMPSGTWTVDANGLVSVTGQ